MFEVNDIVFILPHFITGGRKSSFSNNVARIVSIDSIAMKDGYWWVNVQCGPEMLGYDYVVKSSDLRKATPEEVEEWNTPVTSN